MRLLQSKHDHRAGDVQKMKQGIPPERSIALRLVQRTWGNGVGCGSRLSIAMQLFSMRALGHCSRSGAYLRLQICTYSRLLRNLVRSVSQIDAVVEGRYIQLEKAQDLGDFQRTTKRVEYASRVFHDQTLPVAFRRR